MGKIIRQQQNENGKMKGQNGYVQSEEKKEVGSHFVGRVTSIPIIRDSVSTAQKLTNKTVIGRFALSKASSTLQFAIENQPKYLANYYEQYIYPQVQKADAFGCKSLDIIQQKYPVVNQPTTELIHSIAQPPYQSVKERVDTTIQTVTYPAHLVVQETNKQLSHVIDTLQVVMDKYLPTDQSQSENGEKVKEENQVKRAYDVLSEASRRIGRKVTNSYDLALLQDIKGKLNFIQEVVVKSITVYSTAAQEKLPSSVTFRVHQTVVMVSQITETIHQQLNHFASFLKSQSPEIPDWLKENLQALQQQITDIKNELARTDISSIEKLKHVVHNIQENQLK